MTRIGHTAELNQNMNNRTAIIVSGALRHFKAAANSWQVDGDYYLIVDKDYYDPQSLEAEPNKLDILAELAQCPIKFKNVTVVDELDANNPWTGTPDARLLMTKKWQIGYNVILAQDIQYDRILILRPDLYVECPEWQLLNDVEVNNNIIVSTISFYQYQGLTQSPDLFILCNFTVFAILANFYNVLLTINPLQLRDTENIHSLLADYLIDNGIDCVGHLSSVSTVVLRRNSKHMFTDGLLKNEYTFSDLAIKATEWWDTERRS